MTEQQQFYASKLPQDAPVFHQPWWLEACCAGQWNALTIADGELLRAYFIYAFRKTWLGYYLFMPPLTPYLGPWLLLSANSMRERQHKEMLLLQQLADALPPFAGFESRWLPAYQNWLPFYWKNFQQRLRYTHLLDLTAGQEQLREGFSEKVRREINRAEKTYRIEAAGRADELYELAAHTLNRKRAALHFSAGYLKHVHTCCMEHKAGIIWQAISEQGRVDAAIFVVWDRNTAYYVLGGRKPEAGNSGAMSLLFWHAWKHLPDSVRWFDFEGSMLQGVEGYFRSFGATRVPYLSLRKTNSRMVRCKEALRYVLSGRMLDF